MAEKMLEQFDAVVIGSGFGGAVAACRLSQAGFSVLLLERGRRYEAGDFPALPDDDRLLPDLRRWVWGRDQGLWDVADLGEIVAVQAAGYGGGSLIYANVHLRPPEGAFDKKLKGEWLWPEKFRGDALDPFFDLAAHMLDVAPITAHPGQRFKKTDELNRVTGELHRVSLHPPLAISYQDQEGTENSDALRKCVACGKCCTGCPEGAKSSLDLNYLAVAERNGARVRTQCEVTKLREEPLAAVNHQRWTVTYTDHLCASVREVNSKFVFLCAGAVHSTRLLAGAQLLQGECGVQQRVGLGYFPNADAAGMVYDTATVCEPSSGPTITTGTVHWQNDQFFMIQDGGYAAELERLLGILRAPLWAGRNRTQAAKEPEAPPDEPARRGTAFPGVALVSPLDGLLDAAQEGSLGDACPPAIRTGMASFLKEIEQPLLLPEVVDATIERALRTQHEKSWLRHVLAYDSSLARWLRSVGRKAFDAMSGGRENLASQALRSVLNGADLDRKAYLRGMLNYDAKKATRRMLLLAMGEDAAPGALLVDAKTQEVIADLDLFHVLPGYTNQELLMKDIARKLGGELRLNPLWSFFGKPITVHGQGGCRMSEKPEQGVTQPNGQVHGCPGLYVMDGSVFCQSVGVNPSPSILAISEMNVLEFIRAERALPQWPRGDDSPGARQYARQREGAAAWRARATRQSWDIRPVRSPTVELGSEPIGLRFKESFYGYCAEPDDARRRFTDADYRLLEIKARPQQWFEMHLTVSCRDLNRFFEDMTHHLDLAGTLKCVMPGARNRAPQEFAVKGDLKLLVPRHKPYGLPPHLAAIQRDIAGSYHTVKGPPDPDLQRMMYYDLSLLDRDGKPVEDELRLRAYKRIREDPGLDAWRDTTALFTRLGVPERKDGQALPLGCKLAEVRAAGVVHVDLNGFAFHEVPSFEATGGETPQLKDAQVSGTTDAARINWAIAKFASFFFGTLQRVYSPTTRHVLDAIYRPMPNNVQHERQSPRT
jgi:choline dehydrogenase-like flavoprotein